MRAALGADDVIDGATSSGDAERTKPEPDIIEAALRAARRSTVTGRSSSATPSGTSPLRQAGPALRRRSPAAAPPRAELAGAGAVAVYEDPADLLADLDDSPLTVA